MGHEYKCFIEDNDKQVVTFQYKKLFKSDYVVPYVRLEIGALAKMSDFEQIIVESYICEVNRYLFNKQKSYIIAVNPIRTFWEKITILHREAYRPIDKKCPERYSRHYYDVYCLSKSNLQLFDANSKYLLDQVVRFKEKFYRCPWARYDLAKVGSLKLIPPNYNINFFREDYEKMKEMIYGEKPSFDEILDSLKELEIKINSLENYKKNMWWGVDKIKDKQDDGYEMGD